MQQQSHFQEYSLFYESLMLHKDVLEYPNLP